MDYTEYEIICINDGSTDNSLNILQNYCGIYPNIVVVNQKNSGVSVARNTGIEKAQGKYITFVDSDDMVCKGSYGKLLKCAEEVNASLIRFGFFYWQKKDALELLTRNTNDNTDFSPFITPKIACGNVWAALILLEVIKHNNITFNPTLTMGEDLWFNEQLLCYVKDGTVYQTSAKLYAYRVYEQSSSQNNLPSTIEKKKNSMIKIAELSKDFLMLTKLSQSDYLRIINRQYEAAAVSLTYAFQLGGKCLIETKKLLKEKKLYPYKLTKWFFTKKKSVATYLEMMCRYNIGVYIIAILASLINYIHIARKKRK